MNENTMPNSRVDDEDVEIDLGEVFGAILHRIWIILLVGVLCAGVTFAVSKFVLPEEFESTTQIYVLSKSDGDRGTVTTSDLQAGTQLTKDYAAIITSRYVLEKVIDNLNLDLTYEQLNDKVEVTTPTDTRIISITVTDTDPARAQQIANEIRIEASEHIQNVMDIDAVNIVEEANLPTEKSAPHNTRNAVIGGLVGLLAAIVVVVIRYISDDSIKTQDDVEKYLGLSVLALIPLDEEISRNSVEVTNGRSSRKSKKHADKTEGARAGSRAAVTNRGASGRREEQPNAQEHHHAQHAGAPKGDRFLAQEQIRASQDGADSRQNGTAHRRSGNAAMTEDTFQRGQSRTERTADNGSRNRNNNAARGADRMPSREAPREGTAVNTETVSEETSVINLEDY